MMRAASIALLVTSFAGASAQAGVIDIGAQMGNANIFTLGDFKGTNSDVEGAVVSGGSIDVNGYAINEHNADAFGKDGYAVIARKDIKLVNGSIKHGLAYAGGTAIVSSGALPTASAIKPIDFDAAAAYFKALSHDLSTLDATGTIDTKSWGAVFLEGSGNGVLDIFNMSGATYGLSNDWKLSGLTPQQTLIINVSGTSVAANPNGVSFNAFKPYNVLFNFYEATTLDPRGIFGSVLAPGANVTASWGQVTGNLVVGSWNSTTQVNTGYYFKPAELDGFRDPLPNGGGVPPSGDVPEPGTLALALAGFGAAVLRSRRKRT